MAWHCGPWAGLPGPFCGRGGPRGISEARLNVVRDPVPTTRPAGFCYQSRQGPDDVQLFFANQTIRLSGVTNKWLDIDGLAFDQINVHAQNGEAVELLGKSNTLWGMVCAGASVPDCIQAF